MSLAIYKVTFLLWSSHLVKENSKKKTPLAASSKPEGLYFISFNMAVWIPPDMPTSTEKTLCKLRAEVLEANLHQGWSTTLRDISQIRKTAPRKPPRMYWQCIKGHLWAYVWKWSWLLALKWSSFWLMPTFWAGPCWIALSQERTKGLLSSLQCLKCSVLASLAGLHVLARYLSRKWPEGF